ncbi:HAD-IIB family hydrolase [Sphingorhabdus sp. M41]|uniref:HAD-IIB family hydrolase n=1 Tax=Sphingorhabdus sp. M41 TaxID=1806885 RepID=UPI00078DAEDE|nr:HAD-IIB family hydrolase [Sphingorhabdus sp. M41]AMO71779.1 hypothetical protein AZE99_07855 [Sphingorhabdus sp. M41]
MMSKRPFSPLIFTDLDGTLLDHNSYSAAPADRLIKQICDQSLGHVIPITSKTHAELRLLNQVIPIDESIGVTENGSVIHMSDESPIRRDAEQSRQMMGIEYGEILDRIRGLPPALRVHINGFVDMSADQVSEFTRLPIDNARLAKQREATEPFLWSGTDQEMEELKAIMSDYGIQIQRGGRFYHFTGHATKEQAMAWTKGAFSDRNPDIEYITIALGDGPNDLAMIEAADFGVIMPNPDGVTIESIQPNVRMAAAVGPQGWVLAVREIFSELGLILPES